MGLSGVPMFIEIPEPQHIIEPLFVEEPLPEPPAWWPEPAPVPPVEDPTQVPA